jgi:hypothetical protein
MIERLTASVGISKFCHCRFQHFLSIPSAVDVQDHLLVFYLPELGAWQAAIDRMHAAGFAPVVAFNPYWDRNGVTFEDPDGYRIVLQNAAWSS